MRAKMLPFGYSAGICVDRGDLILARDRGVHPVRLGHRKTARDTRESNHGSTADEDELASVHVGGVKSASGRVQAPVVKADGIARYGNVGHRVERYRSRRGRGTRLRGW